MWDICVKGRTVNSSAKCTKLADNVSRNNERCCCFLSSFQLSVCDLRQLYWEGLGRGSVRSILNILESFTWNYSKLTCIVLIRSTTSICNWTSHVVGQIYCYHRCLNQIEWVHIKLLNRELIQLYSALLLDWLVAVSDFWCLSWPCSASFVFYDFRLARKAGQQHRSRNGLCWT